MFLHGEQVGQDLGWVRFIGQTIPHWHTGIASKFFDLCLRVSAILDAIIHPAQDTSGILHGFLAPDVGASWAYIGDMSTLIECCNLECATGSRRVFFEDEGDLFPFQALYLCSSVFRRFQFSCQVQKRIDLLWCEVVQLEKVPVPQIEPIVAHGLDGVSLRVHWFLLLQRTGFGKGQEKPLSLPSECVPQTHQQH